MKTVLDIEDLKGLPFPVFRKRQKKSERDKRVHERLGEMRDAYLLVLLNTRPQSRAYEVTLELIDLTKMAQRSIEKNGGVVL